MIMHHVADAHQIHIIGQLSIPLPVILWTDKGLDIFSSSKFWDNEHGTTKKYTSEKTGYTYANEHETIVYTHEDEPVVNVMADSTMHMEAEHAHVVEAEHATAHEEAGERANKPMDFSITKSVFGMIFVLLLMLLVFRSVAKAYVKRPGAAPKGIQNLMETLILFIRNEVAIPSLGKKKADRFVPFLLTVFFFIWICNLLGLIPFIGGFNITGTLSITLVLAALVFIITTINGNGHYWMHIIWPPGVPLPIKIILVPIEIMSVFIKPSVLMIRLTANIAAGHIIILAFVSLVLLFGQNNAIAGYSIGVGSVLFMVFMFFIELLVAFLQAYVFTLLAALYFGDATQEHHHDDHH